jgi:hypothetical protein
MALMTIALSINVLGSNMNKQQLISYCPKIFHMAENDSWPNIKKNGLLSSSSLLTLYGYKDEQRNQLESCWRKDKTIITCKGLPNVILRDQKPMPPNELDKCLTDMSVSEWYKYLNSMVFFWTRWKNVEWLLSAREYRNKPHIIITINTNWIVDSYYDKIRLSSINSGSTIYDPEKNDAPHLRGKNTFKTVGSFNDPWVTELTVEAGVQNITQGTVSVDRWISENRILKKIEKIYP